MVFYKVENWHYKFNNLKAAQGTYVEVKLSIFILPWVVPQSIKQN